NVIFGAVHDESMKDHIKITVIATGYKTDRIHFSQASNTSALHSARQTVRSVMARKEKLPVETNLTQVTAEIPTDDLEVPAFIRRRVAEKD
ncbi:MAG: hypothetical protein O7F56_01455, partial [Acidobacteria bacterium]|nr:hypothetical protein [Acidobacteriota bacterium]